MTRSNKDFNIDFIILFVNNKEIKDSTKEI